MNGAVAGVAQSFEITNWDGSSPCAIMACSRSGSLRMNSAVNPPTVDCSVIGIDGPARTAAPGTAAISPPDLVEQKGREVQEVIVVARLDRFAQQKSRRR